MQPLAQPQPQPAMLESLLESEDLVRLVLSCLTCRDACRAARACKAMARHVARLVAAAGSGDVAATAFTFKPRLVVACSLGSRLLELDGDTGVAVGFKDR